MVLLLIANVICLAHLPIFDGQVAAGFRLPHQLSILVILYIVLVLTVLMAFLTMGYQTIRSRPKEPCPVTQI